MMLWVCQLGMATETGRDVDAAFDTGVVVLLKQELARQAQCSGNLGAECNAAEVTAFLKLLGLYYTDERSTPKYPRQAHQVGVNAVVVSELSIVPDGAVGGLEILSRESGEGDAGLKWKWKADGKFCQQFSRAASKNFEGYRFPSVVYLAIDDSRTIQWRTTFVLKGSNSSDSPAQQVDLPTSDTTKINRFYKKQDWLALRESALWAQGTHPLYDHYDLARCFGNQQMFSPALVAQSMLFYGSALTLVSPPRIGEAVLTFQAVSAGLSVVEPAAAASSLEGVTNQQLTGLVSPIELLGAR